MTWLSISCLTLLPAVKLSFLSLLFVREWVDSFLRVQQHILDYFVPYNVVEDMIKERRYEHTTTLQYHFHHRACHYQWLGIVFHQQSDEQLMLLYSICISVTDFIVNSIWWHLHSRRREVCYLQNYSKCPAIPEDRTWKYEVWARRLVVSCW